MSFRGLSLAILAATLSMLAVPVRAAEAMLDLTRAVVVSVPDMSKSEKKAVAMLVEEVEARTRVRWRVVTSWPEKGNPVVAVGPGAVVAVGGSPRRR